MRVYLIFLGLCLLVGLALVVGCATKNPAFSSSKPPIPSTKQCFSYHPSTDSTIYVVFDGDVSAGVSENSCSDAERALADVPVVMCSHLDNGNYWYAGADGQIAEADSCAQAWYNWAENDTFSVTIAPMAQA